MATLLTDDNGMPIPQIYDVNTNTFIPLTGGTGLGMDARITNKDELDGLAVSLLDVDKNPLPVTPQGIPVVVHNNRTVALMDKGGELDTLSLAIANTPLSITDAGTTALTESFWNSQGRNLLLAFQIISGSGTINAIKLQVKFGTEFLDYKTINSNISSGVQYVHMGLDASGEFQFMIPAAFRISITHSSGASLNYKLGVQIV